MTTASTETTALIAYRGPGLASAEYWVTLSEAERRRRALDALQRRDTPALWHLTEGYLRTYSPAGGALSPHTLRNYKTGLQRLLADWRTVDLRTPSRDAAALWVRQLETRGVAGADGTAQGMMPATVGIYVAAARKFYAALRWAGATTADPFADVHPARDKTPPWDKREPYTDAQVTALLAIAPPVDQVLILLLAHAGLRISEALDLAWPDVQLDRRRLFVRHGKGGKQGYVDIGPTLLTALGEQRTRSEGSHVLPYRHRSRAWQRLKVIAEQAGVPWLALHAFRHTAGTWVYAQTDSLDATARLLRHQQIETTRRYAKYADDTLKRTLSQR